MAMVAVMLVLFGITALSVIGVIEATRAQSSEGDITQDSKNTLGLAMRRGDQYQAQVLSEAGIRMAIQWLVLQQQTPNNTTTFAPSAVADFYGGSTQNGNWTKVTFAQGPTSSELSGVGQVNGDIYVKFYPYSTNSTVGYRKMFAIESRGEYGGRTFLSRVFVRQNSFARFAYFSDVCPTSWWVYGMTRFQGPVHINGINSAGTGVDTAATLSIIWRRQSSKEIFTYPDSDYFTTAMSASQLMWYRYVSSSSTTAQTPSSSTDWLYVTKAGVAPQTGMPIITMPTATSQQQSSALGTASAITSIGVQIPGTSSPTAGIYVNGDVWDLNLTTSGTSNTTQIMTLYQNDPVANKDIRTTITLDPVANTTVLKVEKRDNATDAFNISATGTWTTTSTTNYVGVPNGVVYVNGNIGEQSGSLRGGLSGAVANSVVDGNGVVTRTWSMNIVTEQSKTVNINGGIVYQNLISSSSNANNLLSTAAAPLTASGMLGLVAGNIKLVDTDDGGTALTNISVHAACMAYGTFNATNPTTRAVGAFNLLGGYIVKTNGTFGTALPTGAQETGFLVNRNYDQRLADTPPPAYPAADKSYQIVSYQRAVTPLN